jgi:gamma-glutamyltranspeptidase
MNDGRTVMLDFREVAPAAASVDMFVGKPGLRYPTIKNTTHTHTHVHPMCALTRFVAIPSTVGGMAVAVPGELAGLEYAWRYYGSGNVPPASL